jgi:hypothetical protein
VIRVWIRIGVALFELLQKRRFDSPWNIVARFENRDKKDPDRTELITNFKRGLDELLANHNCG